MGPITLTVTSKAPESQEAFRWGWRRFIFSCLYISCRKVCDVVDETHIALFCVQCCHYCLIIVWYRGLLPVSH
jgi:hypothetical protein